MNLIQKAYIDAHTRLRLEGYGVGVGRESSKETWITSTLYFLARCRAFLGFVK